MITRLFFLAAIVAAPVLAQAESAFAKSMLTRTDSEGKTEKVDGILRITSDSIRFDAKQGGEIFNAPFGKVTKLVYERTKKPRYSAGLLLAWPLLFTKEKQHYLTVEASGSFAFIKLQKDHYRAAIAAVESASGRQVERLEE
jgi:hypothetical protein